jgi:hypothetical protein
VSKTYQLPRGATGIDHHSGASFRANRFGRVELPDKIARDFEKNGALRHYDVIAAASGQILGLGGKQDRGCPRCFRTAWDWEEKCGRCGTPLPPKEQDGKHQDPA